MNSAPPARYVPLFATLALAKYLKIFIQANRHKNNLIHLRVFPKHLVGSNVEKI